MQAVDGTPPGHSGSEREANKNRSLVGGFQEASRVGFLLLEIMIDMSCMSQCFDHQKQIPRKKVQKKCVLFEVSVPVL